MIEHRWRPQKQATTKARQAELMATPMLERPCAFSGCGRLRDEHPELVVDWARYRKCRACGAEMGEPCASMTGSEYLTADRPHGGRELRTGDGR